MSICGIGMETRSLPLRPMSSPCEMYLRKFWRMRPRTMFRKREWSWSILSDISRELSRVGPGGRLPGRPRWRQGQLTSTPAASTHPCPSPPPAQGAAISSTGARGVGRAGCGDGDALRRRAAALGCEPAFGKRVQAILRTGRADGGATHERHVEEGKCRVRARVGGRRPSSAGAAASLASARPSTAASTTANGVTGLLVQPARNTMVILRRSRTIPRRKVTLAWLRRGSLAGSFASLRMTRG